MPQFSTLLVGCGHLGEQLAIHFLKDGRLDILTRSYHREGTIQRLFKKAPHTKINKHYVRDIGNSRFSFDLKPYQRIIFCPAVSVDRRLTNAAEKIHVKGTRNFLNQCIKSQFRGQLVMIGCAQALMDCTLPQPANQISESLLPKLDISDNQPLWQQYKLFENFRKQTCVCHPFIFCGQIYASKNYPEPKTLGGLTVTTRDPDYWINLIHIDDAADVVRHIIYQELTGDFILTDGHPIKRSEYYRRLTAQFGRKSIKLI